MLIFVGDSIALGTCQAVQSIEVAKCDAIVGWSPTYDRQHLVQRALQDAKPGDRVVILAGMNDAKTPVGVAWKIDSIRKDFLAKGCTVVVGSIPEPSNRFLAGVRSINEELISLGPVVIVNPIGRTDGVHLTPEGYAKEAQALVDASK